MKLIQLTLHINYDEADTIITFIDELKLVLSTHYGEEIRENHRASSVITDKTQHQLARKKR